jgi:hypothetical protein
MQESLYRWIDGRGKGDLSPGEEGRLARARRTDRDGENGKADLKSETEKHRETNPENKSIQEGTRSFGGALETAFPSSRFEMEARILKHQWSGFYLSIPDGEHRLQRRCRRQ